MSMLSWAKCVTPGTRACNPDCLWGFLRKACLLIYQANCGRILGEECRERLLWRSLYNRGWEPWSEVACCRRVDSAADATCLQLWLSNHAGIMHATWEQLATLSYWILPRAYSLTCSEPSPLSPWRRKLIVNFAGSPHIPFQWGRIALSMYEVLSKCLLHSCPPGTVWDVSETAVLP